MPKANYLQNRFGKCVTGFQALNCVRFLFATLWSYVRIAFAPSRALSLSLAITLKSIQYFYMPNATLARCLCQSREREREKSVDECVNVSGCGEKMKLQVLFLLSFFASFMTLETLQFIIHVNNFYVLFSATVWSVGKCRGSVSIHGGCDVIFRRCVNCDNFVSSSAAALRAEERRWDSRRRGWQTFFSVSFQHF